MTLGDNEFFLERVLEQGVRPYAPVAKASGVELLVVSSHDLPTVCVGDAVLVQKLVTGLIGQAAFIRDGEVRLDAFVVQGEPEIRRDDDRCVHLGFAVTSIPPVNFERSPSSLLQRHNQLPWITGELQSSRDACQELARLLGGGVQIFDAPGPGWGLRADIVLGVSASPSPLSLSPPPLESSVKALVIDDNATVRAVMTETLQRLGLEAFSAASFEAAASVIQKEPGRIDVVFVDGGLVCNEARHAMLSGGLVLAPEAPVVIMDHVDDSGSIGVLDSNNAAHTTLLKPVTRRAVCQALGSVFGRGATAVQAASGAPEGDALAGLRALVVDDNPFNLEVFEPILEMLGIQVATANSGREALAILESERDFDVVLMDMQMPGMDGCEATRSIRANPRLRTLPVLALTANDDPLACEQCLASGMNDFLTKPLDTPAMIRALKRWRPR